jgi:hypothetical protein
VKRNTHVKLDFKTLVFVAWVICTLIEQSEAAEQDAADKLFREHVGCSYVGHRWTDTEAGGEFVWAAKVRVSKSEDGFDHRHWDWKPEGYKFRHQIGAHT